jgi:hypothetical protein
MKNRFITLFLSLLTVSISLVTTAAAADRDTLVDISGVAVIIEEISESALKDGLKPEYLKTLVEQKLTDAQILVLEERKWFSVFGGAYILVKFIGSKSLSEEYYIVFVDVELYQTVVLLGKKLGENITTTAATWSTGKLFTCSAPVLKECVGGAVSELTDLFIEDCKTVNSEERRNQDTKMKKKR